MTNEIDKEFLYCLLIVMISILLLSGIITGGIYYYHKLQIDNFQKTILNLSDEQKCLHICGFEFDGYFESYKFCAEKCDRISERLHEVKI
jgi:uncharacterized protein YxeA